MVSHKFKKLSKNTYEFEVTVTSDQIKTEYEKAFNELRADFSFEGFRKGKVPVDIAKKHLSKNLIYERIIRNMLPKIYEEIVKKENLRPIISPKINILEAQENKDWKLKITTAGKPTVQLGNYKEIVKKAKGEENKADIWVPGKEKKPEEETKETKDHRLLDKILAAILRDVKVEISDLLIEEEMNQKLSRLLDDIQKIGLTVDAYLKSRNTTIEKLKEQVKREIVDTFALEFILMEIAEQEKITVDENDLDKLFANIKDPKEKASAQSNAYFYASVMRKQKVIDYLLGL